MSLRKETPCDYGECPYDAETNSTCEYWCGEEEPEEYPDYERNYFECDEESED